MPAHKPIRRGQLISPFGIGAMVDFPKDESLMPAGLDAWPHAKDECPKESGWLLVEERLQARLGVTHFRLPPDHRDPDRGSRFTNLNVPFIRFPRWHYCPFCGGMELLPLFEATRVHCQEDSMASRAATQKKDVLILYLYGLLPSVKGGIYRISRLWNGSIATSHGIIQITSCV